MPIRAIVQLARGRYHPELKAKPRNVRQVIVAISGWILLRFFTRNSTFLSPTAFWAKNERKPSDVGVTARTTANRLLSSSIRPDNQGHGKPTLRNGRMDTSRDHDTKTVGRFCQGTRENARNNVGCSRFFQGGREFCEYRHEWFNGETPEVSVRRVKCAQGITHLGKGRFTITPRRYHDMEPWPGQCRQQFHHSQVTRAKTLLQIIKNGRRLLHLLFVGRPPTSV
ncbi:MAG: hypothetical protein KatS3mg110_0433 [Pirellulaceae bacterium]|nr:MAG: hypothetical protein KatS3mg110_0433 [Pirellulaceae bacterium]